MKLHFLSALCVLLLCQGAFAQGSMTQEEYILKYKDLVLQSQEKYGIPASIKMAQGLLESANGNSRLATQANNHFGIKCKSDWTGKTISHDDDAKGECFRKYDTAEASFKDHSEFLDSSPRYQSLFDLKPNDYKGWAQGLSKAGYATNPKYPELLINLIERFELYTLDTEHKVSRNVLAAAENRDKDLIAQASESDVKIDTDNYMVSLRKSAEYSVFANNGSEFVVANKDSSIATISKHFKVSESRLYKFNDLEKGSSIKPGDQVYIRAKAKRSINGKLIHTGTEGESLRSVSQRYGIKLKSVSRMNKLKKDATLHQGQQIRLM